MLHIHTHNGTELIIIKYPIMGYWMYLSHGNRQRVGMVYSKRYVLITIARFIKEVL